MSSPLLKGGVLLRGGGGVEEAPNDGWAYARHYNGASYEWTTSPHFEGPVGIGTASPACLLHVYEDGAGVGAVGKVESDTGNAGVEIYAGNASDDQAYVQLVQGGGTPWSNSCEITQAYDNLYIQNRHSTGSVILLANSSEAMRILPSGRVGIGTTNPQRPLHVVGSGGNALYLEGATSSNSILQISPNGSYYNSIRSNLSDSANFGIVWEIQGTDRMYLDATALSIKEASSGGSAAATWGRYWVKNSAPNTPWFMRDNGTTGQIAMDYEEGTWTPTLQDYSYSNSEGQTYNRQFGYYTRIGRLVFVKWDLEVNSLGSLTTSDAPNVAGLPFQPSPSGGYSSCPIGYYQSAALPTYRIPGALFVDSTNRILMTVINNSGTTSALMTIAQWSAGGRFTGDGFYLTA